MMFRIFAALVLVYALGVTSLCMALEIDFSKAVVIGSGPKTIVEFTDPDCPFCRTASKYFEGRADLTRYIFFYPLPRHPKAKEKAQYVLSQQDKAGAYREVMAGRFDHVAKQHGITEKGVKLQEEQMEIAKKAKVNATPTFIVNGRVFEGLDQKKIEEALGTK
jgi:thiol:disulfide interchange protein DsbC